MLEHVIQATGAERGPAQHERLQGTDHGAEHCPRINPPSSVAGIDTSFVAVVSRTEFGSDISLTTPIMTAPATWSAIQVHTGNSGTIRCSTAPVRTPLAAP